MTSLVGVCTTRAGQTSSFFAASLAWAAAADRDVVLLDLDMEGGTLSDLLLLATADRSIGNCVVERPPRPVDIEAQAVSVPRRKRLHVVPGLRHTYGAPAGEVVRHIADALRHLACDLVIADLGSPLAHPGLRSPRAVADSITAGFERLLVVIRDEPALLARSIDVLRAARLSHGEIVVCRQRSAEYRKAIDHTLRNEVPELPLREGWRWDPSRAAHSADTGTPMSLEGAFEELHL